VHRKCCGSASRSGPYLLGFAPLSRMPASAGSGLRDKRPAVVLPAGEPIGRFFFLASPLKDLLFFPAEIQPFVFHLTAVSPHFYTRRARGLWYLLCLMFFVSLPPAVCGECRVLLRTNKSLVEGVLSQLMLFLSSAKGPPALHDGCDHSLFYLMIFS